MFTLRIICRILQTIMSTGFSKVRFCVKVQWTFRSNVEVCSLNEKVISGLESLPELAQETRANYLDTLLVDNINAAVEFGTYLVGFASIVSYEGIEGADMRVGGGVRNSTTPRDVEQRHFQTAGFLLGEAASSPFNLVGYVISDLAYTYEYFVEFEGISKDCTTE